MKKILIKVLIGSLCGAALIATIGIIAGSFNDVIGKAMATMSLIVGFSIWGLIYTNIDEKTNYKMAVDIGMIFNTFIFAFSVLTIWINLNIDDRFYTTIYTIASFIFWVNVLLLIKEATKVISYIKVAALAFIITFCIVFEITIWYSIDGDSIIYRLMAVLAIFSLLGTGVPALLLKLNEKENK